MSDISGTNVGALVCPFTTDDQYPVTDSKYGKGGWREVATVEERDNIPTPRRTAGMAVYVTDTNKLYILGSDLTTWTEFAGGSGGGATWGSITGTLSNQTDLKNALDAKLENEAEGMEGTVYIATDGAGLYSNSTVIGKGTTVSAEYSTVYGCEAISEAESTVVIGDNARVSANYGTALGSEAQVSGDESIQIGSGNNEEDYTFKVGFSSIEENYKLLDGTTGVIPYERLSTTTPEAEQVLYYNEDEAGLSWKTIDVPSYTPGTGISISNNSISAINLVARANNRTIVSGDSNINTAVKGLVSLSYGVNYTLPISATPINTTIIGSLNYLTIAANNNTVVGGKQDSSPLGLASGNVIVGSGIPGKNNLSDPIQYSTSVGYNALSNHNGVAIGANSITTGSGSIAIGKDANGQAASSIQLGTGTNSNANTFQVFSYQVLDSAGHLPKERLSSTTPTSDQVLYYDGTGLSWKTVSSGSSYTPGTGISITNNVISVDTTTIQSKLTPSTGITITNNTISATAATASTRGAVKLTSVSNSKITDGAFTCNYITTTLGLNAPISSILVDKFKNDQAVIAEISSLANLEMNNKFKVANTLPSTLASGTWLALLEE